jgi:mono/diheme cytochrome c family protein
MWKDLRFTRPRRLAALLALPGLAVLAFATAAGERKPGGSTSDSPAARLYREECGSCHVPYPARGLPPSSWRAVMAQLERHFGSDASVDASVGRTIQAWLQANAGREPATPPARPTLRLTEMRWFLHEHDEIGAAVFRRQAIKGPANCAACHPRAAEGRFSEREIRIPAR